jgi:hypothetical protein
MKNKTNKINTKNFEDNILKKSEEISGVSIKGYDFNKKLDYCKPFQGLGDYFLCPKHLSLRNS